MPRGCPDGMIPQMENISYDARGNITSRSPRYGSGGTVTLTYTGDRLATRKVGTGTAVSFAHDSFARMTTDAEAGLSITYNALDLPETVSMGNTLKAKYTYLSDGTKVSALGASGAGLVYRGPFIYRRSSGGTLAFESAPFDRGRLTEDGTRYHVTDHLGSVRAVIDGNASTTTYPLAGFYSVDDFAPFGVKSASSASSYLSLASTGSTVSLRDGFTGQEDQGPDFSVGYSDFGARQYSPSLSRWLVPDPMGEKYYDVSPYAYCAGNPVKIIDLDGNKIRVATDYQDQFISDITNVFGDKAEHFSFSKEGLLQLDCKKGIFTKGMSVEQKQVFRGLYKAMIDRKTTSIVYSDDYTVTNGDENESKSVVQEYGGGFYSKTDNLIVVAPSVGVISVTVDPLQDPLGGTFRVQDVQQNTTSALFHEIGERNTNSSYRGAVIDYENYVRTIIELPIRPYDIFHSSMIPQIEP